ncbi:MAG: Secretion system C-terminal sorting domain, partial [Bacteroidota bacterium]
DYAIADNALPEPGTWFYRIKALDAEGQAVFSETVSFEFSPSFPLISAVFPSPSGGQAVGIKSWIPSGQWVHVQLMDAQGKSLLTVQFACTAGENFWPIPTENLPSGTYLVRISCGSGSASTKLIISR